MKLKLGEMFKPLYGLALGHHRFAVNLAVAHWRQRVSRMYFAAYAASRAVRLHTSGQYSTEVKDHQRIGELPDDFPAKAQFANRLDLLRADRNTCDYGHLSSANDLSLSTTDTTQLVTDFLTETRNYLIARGLQIRGKP